MHNFVVVRVTVPIKILKNRIIEKEFKYETQKY